MMKREIPAVVVVIVVVVVLALVGFFYGRVWFQGPKEMSAMRPTNIQRPVPPTGQQRTPVAPPPAPGGYGR